MKIEILMGFKKIILFTGLLGLFACAAHKGMGTKEVTIQINNALPHCGGAAPMPDVVYPQIEALPNCSLSIYEVTADGKRGQLVSTIISNDKGSAMVQLKNGKYQLWRPSKLLSFEEFMKKESPALTEEYKYRDTDCFRLWYNRPDFEFEVGDQNAFEFNYKNNCFVGSHPCLEYDGPWPP